MKSIFGSLGGVFFGLCCAGTPVILAFLTGIGLGFVINDFVLFPLLFIFLGIMFYSMRISKKKHMHSKPIYLAIISSVVLLVGIFKGWIIWIGVIGLFIATIWDYYLLRNCRRSC